MVFNNMIKFFFQKLVSNCFIDHTYLSIRLSSKKYIRGSIRFDNISIPKNVKPPHNTRKQGSKYALICLPI